MISRHKIMICTDRAIGELRLPYGSQAAVTVRWRHQHHSKKFIFSYYASLFMHAAYEACLLLHRHILWLYKVRIVQCYFSSMQSYLPISIIWMRTSNHIQPETIKSKWNRKFVCVSLLNECRHRQCHRTTYTVSHRRKFVQEILQNSIPILSQPSCQAHN